MGDDIKKEYERFDEYANKNIYGGIVKEKENAINEWENRISFSNDEDKQIYFKIGEVYVAQIKNIGRLMYDENTYGYKTMPVEFKGADEKFVSSLYTFFIFGGEGTFTEMFSGEKFILVNDDMKKQQIWEFMDNGIVLSISELKEVNDDLLLDIARETIGRKEDVACLILQKQEDVTETIKTDKLKDKNDAFLMASAENLMRSAKCKTLTQHINHITK